MKRIRLSRAGLRSVLLFAATRDIRYYLNSVKVEATSTATRVIGCDGHTLAMHHSKQANEVDEPTEVIVPRQVVELIRKKKKPGLLDVVLEETPGGWIVRDCVTGLRFGFDPVQGKYPDYMRVFPEKLSGEFGFINPEYVGRLSRAAAELGCHANRVALMHNGSSAALARIRNANEFAAILMPMNGDVVGEVTRPDWLTGSLITTAQPEAIAA